MTDRSGDTDDVIEFFYWRDCPSYERALSRLIAAMDDNGLEREHLRITEVITDADARREEFVGSPTIRIDGRDIADLGDNPVGLTCRVYQRRDGTISPLPDPEDLARAVREYVESLNG